MSHLTNVGDCCPKKAYPDYVKLQDKQSKRNINPKSMLTAGTQSWFNLLSSNRWPSSAPGQPPERLAANEDHPGRVARHGPGSGRRNHHQKAQAGV
jgi:hypothetical protein